MGRKTFTAEQIIFKLRKVEVLVGQGTSIRPAWKNHAWAYDFVQCRTANGKAFRVIVVIDECSRECLALHAARKIRSEQATEPEKFIALSNPL